MVDCSANIPSRDQPEYRIRRGLWIPSSFTEAIISITTTITTTNTNHCCLPQPHHHHHHHCQDRDKGHLGLVKGWRGRDWQPWHIACTHNQTNEEMKKQTMQKRRKHANSRIFSSIGTEGEIQRRIEKQPKKSPPLCTPSSLQNYGPCQILINTPLST